MNNKFDSSTNETRKVLEAHFTDSNTELKIKQKYQEEREKDLEHFRLSSPISTALLIGSLWPYDLNINNNSTSTSEATTTSTATTTTTTTIQYHHQYHYQHQMIIQHYQYKINMVGLENHFSFNDDTKSCCSESIDEDCSNNNVGSNSINNINTSNSTTSLSSVSSTSLQTQKEFEASERSNNGNLCGANVPGNSANNLGGLVLTTDDQKEKKKQERERENLKRLNVKNKRKNVKNKKEEKDVEEKKGLLVPKAQTQFSHDLH
ncbi:hypothetical protein ACTFIU_010475 [Dictyostelium citrinum]